MGFFESRKQTKIFLDSFQSENLIFYLEATKDYVDEKLKSGCKASEKAYIQYMQNRKDLVGLLKGFSSFIKMPVNQEKSADYYYNRIINDYLALGANNTSSGSN